MSRVYVTPAPTRTRPSSGAHSDSSVDAREVEHGGRPRVAEVERDHEVGAARERHRVGPLGLELERLGQRAGLQDLQAWRVGHRRSRMTSRRARRHRLARAQDQPGEPDPDREQGHAHGDPRDAERGQRVGEVERELDREPEREQPDPDPAREAVAAHRDGVLAPFHLLALQRRDDDAEQRPADEDRDQVRRRVAGVGEQAGQEEVRRVARARDDVRREREPAEARERELDRLAAREPRDREEHAERDRRDQGGLGVLARDRVGGDERDRGEHRLRDPERPADRVGERRRRRGGHRRHGVARLGHPVKG